MALIHELDFIGIPSQDAERARSFYRDVLGMRPDEHAEYEQWAGRTCFAVWEPERVGMEFVAVCHMAIFADPDGNQLMLHHRYVPYGNGHVEAV